MNRRTFLGSSSAGIASLITNIAGCGVKKEESAGNNQFVADNGKLAGFTLEELREQYRQYLFNDFLPFMEKYVIDYEYGGFMCNTDRDGTNISQ